MFSSAEKLLIARFRLFPTKVLPLFAILCASVFVRAQSKVATTAGTASGESAGKKLFSTRCAGCHGLDGGGGQRAPNIATDPRVRRLSNAELFRVISNGRTDFGMPSFQSLGAVGVQGVVDYLRTLQGNGSAATPAGNPRNGRAIFFGKAGCSSCHRVAGQAGFVGSDLSSYARGISPLEVKKAITDPAPAPGRARTALAVTVDGRTFSGAVKNEDNFSIQMQNRDGVFHLLMKSDLVKLEYQTMPSMPTDYDEKLTPQELDDLVGYLRSIASDSDPAAEE